ncbi:MAG: glycoside hydrolase family 3 N-terminal domain-containing protein, partial [Candidatus Eisenbacteria bacterium]
MDAQRGIARRFVIGIPDEGPSPAWERDVTMYAPAGFIVFRRHFRDLDDLRRLTHRLRELARPRRVFVALDEEGGFVSQLAGHLTVPPNATLLARGAAPGDLEFVARVTGERLRALGFDWDFAPVADVHSETDNPVIGPRAFGTTPEAVSAAVGDWLDGFRAAGIASCLKHFPGHGDTVLDSHVALPRFERDLATLEKRELAPFRAHPDADAVMTAHVVYPALDPSAPASLSRLVTHDLLRERLGFRGIAITDALEMKGATADRAPAELARLALEAGNDLLLYAFHDEAVRRVRLDLARLLVEGGLDHAAFDEARPRLAAFDQTHHEPTADELARPLETLTPPDWETRLTAIIERGLIERGALPRVVASGAWRITEPAFPHGPTLRETLAGLGVPVDAGASPACEVVAVMSRLPVPDDEITRLRALARERPLALIGLQNDAFLA